jgi:outer membrane protein
LTLLATLPYNYGIRTAEFSGRVQVTKPHPGFDGSRLSRVVRGMIASITGISKKFPEQFKELHQPMKRTTLTGSGLLACLLAITAVAQTGSTASSPAASPAASASGSSIKVGIIDIQQAIVGTNEGARDFEALQKKFEPKRTELSNLSTEIDNLKKQLNAQGDKMNEDARANLVKSIETKQKSLQRSGEDAQNEYQQQQNEIAQRILQKMAPVIDKYAKSNNYSLLLDSSNPWPQGPLLWATPSVDLTKTIVDTYNAQSGVAPPPSAPKPSTGAANRPAGSTPAATKPSASATKP